MRATAKVDLICHGLGASGLWGSEEEEALAGDAVCWVQMVAEKLETLVGS